jgi:hypothetical protein
MMALAVIVASVSGVVVASLAFANAIHRRWVAYETDADEKETEQAIPREARLKAIEVRRAILTERRKIFLECFAKTSGEVASKNWKGITAIDTRLIELADEEAKLS